MVGSRPREAGLDPELAEASEELWSVANEIVVRTEGMENRGFLFHAMVGALMAFALAVSAAVVALARNYVRLNLGFGAVHDPLTRLPNKAFYDEFLARMQARADRYGERFAVILADLDEFRSLNARIGRAECDRVLGAIAGRLQGELRKGDAVFRIGSDEFAVFVPNAGEDEGVAVAEKIRAAVKTASGIEGLGASLAVAVNEPGETAEALSKRLDAALFSAKEEGRDRVVPASRAGRPPDAEK